MIRFIDLRGQILETVPQFAFYDTVTDRFFEFGGEQVWTTFKDFQSTFKQEKEGQPLERFKRLMPKDWPEEFDWD